MYFVVTVFSNLFVYILFIGLQVQNKVQNKSICQSSFYVERKIRDKQSKSKTLTKLVYFNSLAMQHNYSTLTVLPVRTTQL